MASRPGSGCERIAEAENFRGGGLVKCTLVMEEVNVLVPGTTRVGFKTYGYNAAENTPIGPTIFIRPGDTLNVSVLSI